MIKRPALPGVIRQGLFCVFLTRGDEKVGADFHNSVSSFFVPADIAKIEDAKTFKTLILTSYTQQEIKKCNFEG